MSKALKTVKDNEAGLMMEVPSYLEDLGGAKELSILNDVDITNGLLRLSLDKERFTVMEGRTEVRGCVDAKHDRLEHFLASLRVDQVHNRVTRGGTAFTFAAA